MLIRLIIPRIDPDSHQRLGVFGAGYDLLRDIELADHDRRAIRDSLDWFCDNLIAPDEVDPRAIFWFKDNARDCIGELWHMARLLREYDHAIEMIRTRRPGYVVYQDDLQLAAIPFKNHR